MFWDMMLGVTIATTAGVITSLTNKYIINNDNFCRYKQKVINKMCGCNKQQPNIQREKYSCCLRRSKKSEEED